jgi:hypothetical protein
MRQENEQMEGIESEDQRPDESDDGDRSADSIRSKIGDFLRNPDFRKTLDAESLRNYEALAKKDGNTKSIDGKRMAGFYSFMKDKFEEIQTVKKRMSGLIAHAIKGGVIAEKDREFYQQKIHENVFTGNQIVTKEMMEKAERELAESLKKRESERLEYDSISKNPIVKNGMLAVSETEKIKIPDEKRYLKMSVPDRRELLKKLKEALPRAEKYAEKTGQVESKELTEKYKGLLEKAYGKKIIGKKTYEKFLDGFKKIGKSEKETWVKEFPEQMVRYEKLWQEIRSSLKGKALDHMESLRDEKGYTELFTEFGKTRDTEKNRMDKEYDSKLEKSIQQGVIGKNTAGEFKKWMKSQDLESKYDAVDKLHDGPGGQMERYKKLHDDIGKNLSGKQQEYIHSKLDGWGYTETKAQYDKFMKGEKLPSDEGASKESNTLAAIRSTAVKTAIIETEIALKEKGADKKQTFLSSIKRIFRNERRDDFDAKGFQARLHKDREQLAGQDKPEGPHKEGVSASVMDLQQKLVRERAKSNGPEEKTRKNLHEVDKSGVEEEMSELEGSGKAHVLKEEGFKQVESIEDGRTQRKTQVEINREKGMNKFLSENSKRGFKGKAEGGKDDVSLAVHMQDGRAVELNLGDIRAMEKYFEEKDTEQKAA